ncbi:MAG: VOC family protein [Dehalococcoidia bacterium]
MSMQTVIPMLHVSSIEQSVDFYKEKLGFDLEFAMNGDGGKMLHASVSNGDVKLMIGYPDGEARPLGGGAELYIMTDAVDAYHARVRDAGTALSKEITDEWWGDRLFTVTDPDGYVLTFAQTVREFDPSRIPTAATA